MNTVLHCLIAALAGGVVHWIASFAPIHPAFAVALALFVFALVIATDLGLRTKA